MTTCSRRGIAGSSLWKLLLGTALVCGACSSSSGGGEGGSGGSAGAGTGGTTGLGGSGTGGGHGGTAGATSTGGAAGATSTGGAGGAGGAGADGGAVSCTLPGTTLATFDTTNEGFSYNTNPGASNLAVATNDGGIAATLAFTGTDGDPCKGSLQAIIPFTGYNQQVQIVKDFGSGSLQDWTGKTLHVRVKIVSGFTVDPAVSPGMQAYVTSFAPGVDGGSDQFFFSGLYQNLKSGGEWNEYTYSMATAGYSAPGFDITKVENFGVILQTPNPPSTDGGHVTPNAAEVDVDSFYLTD